MLHRARRGFKSVVPLQTASRASSRSRSKPPSTIIHQGEADLRAEDAATGAFVV